MKATDKEFNPFAVNILRLQRYNYKLFTLEEIVFFEYMIIKAKAFKYKPFYSSHRSIFSTPKAQFNIL